VVPAEDVLAALSGARVDGVVWPLQEAGPWAEAHPGFTAVAPAHMRGPVLFVYLVPPGALIFRHYLNEWLDLKAADGFRKAQIDYWMKGKPRADRPPRWNLLDVMIGMVRR
jgi:hypothetical protein